MSFTSIIAKITSILAGITEIKEVHNYDKGKFGGYPSAVVFPSENTSDFETTNQNRREYIFTIRLHQVMEGLGSTPHETADRILRETVDEVIDTFDANFSLDGVVNFCQATPSTWGYQERDTGVVRIAEIKLVCVRLVTV